ncbi:hypothetical protein FN846DRAFT_911051 [Sphaerosporella brunnea]|uniref:BZIP domain-containing protein n=1 Tax=Sphaerosporella brunnea TaxID=1250544 RepID=A0A5J5EKD1_9PEZI|nr:hypothetical protein FN846DRAFT_911051 [Sphaerosporella brunnea]
MASYQQPPFYSAPGPQFPPTPNPQHDEFSLPYYDASFGFGNPFDLGGGSLPPQGHSPPLGGGDSSSSTRGGRGSSEEKELTPGQRRRKEQNRAAQRAFRERKERHVKELESRLASLEQANSRAVAENDKLKEQLEKTRLENRLLHENTLRSNGGAGGVEVVGPMAFKPLDPDTLQVAGVAGPSIPPAKFTSPIFGQHPNRGPIHRITTSPGTGERLLGAGAAWDLIVCHPLYEQGLVDIGDISERLKHLARCDGQGPVFEESIILDAIHASSGSGRDELLVYTCSGSGY